MSVAFLDIVESIPFNPLKLSMKWPENYMIFLDIYGKHSLDYIMCRSSVNDWMSHQWYLLFKTSYKASFSAFMHLGPLWSPRWIHLPFVVRIQFIPSELMFVRKWILNAFTILSMWWYNFCPTVNGTRYVWPLENQGHRDASHFLCPIRNATWGSRTFWKVPSTSNFVCNFVIPMAALLLLKQEQGKNVQLLLKVFWKSLEHVKKKMKEGIQMSESERKIAV